MKATAEHSVRAESRSDKTNGASKTTAQGFLGVMSPEHRDATMGLSLQDLIARLALRLNEQAEVSQYTIALAAAIEEGLPHTAECEAAEAVLWAVRRALKESDNALCEFGGYFEALIVRLEEVTHG